MGTTPSLLAFFCLLDTSGAHLAQFTRFLSASDPDIPSLFVPLGGSKVLGSCLECASLAGILQQNATERIQRPSAFSYIKGQCVVGRGLAYVDHLMQKPELHDLNRDGVYFLTKRNRLSAVDNFGALFHVIFNEEHDFFHGQAANYLLFPDFTLPPLSNFIPSLPSPIRTFNGEYAIDFIMGPSIRYELPRISLKDFSIFSWYNSGTNSPARDCIVRMVSTDTSTQMPGGDGSSYISIWELFVAADNVYPLATSSPPNGVEFYDRDRSAFTNYRMSTTAPNVIPTNEWIHIGVVVDQTNAQISFYLNGTLESTKPLISKLPLPQILDYGEINLLEIGRNVYNIPFNAHLASLTINPQALGPTEVGQVFANSLRDPVDIEW